MHISKLPNNCKAVQKICEPTYMEWNGHHFTDNITTNKPIRKKEWIWTRS